MKKLALLSSAFLLLLLSSCSAIEGIFKAGYYVGIFVVVFIIFIGGFIYSKFKS